MDRDNDGAIVKVDGDDDEDNLDTVGIHNDIPLNKSNFKQLLENSDSKLDSEC